jgi:hypothetical protein
MFAGVRAGAGFADRTGITKRRHDQAGDQLDRHPTQPDSLAQANVSTPIVNTPGLRTVKSI